MSPWPTDTPVFKPNDDIFKAKAILKRDFLFETKQDRQGSRGGLFKVTEETPTKPVNGESTVGESDKLM